MNDAKIFFCCCREDFQNGSHFSIISLWSFIAYKEGHCGGVVCQTATLLRNVLNIHITPTGRYLEWMQMDQSGLFLSTRTSHYNGGTEGVAMGGGGGLEGLLYMSCIGNERVNQATKH